MRLVLGLLISLPLLAGSTFVSENSFGPQAGPAAAANVSSDATPKPVTVVEVDKPIMTRIEPEFSREAITSLPIPDFVEVDTLRERLGLNSTQASRILFCLQQRQNRLISIDRDADLSSSARAKQIATVVKETDSAIRKVLNRSQRRGYDVASREFSVQ